MTTYSITAPNGQTYQIEGPPGASASQVAQAVLAQNPEAGQPPSKERTFGEAATDIGASAISGLGSLVQLPGQLYGLATGDFAKTGALGLGEDIQKYGEEMKSTGLKAREAIRSRKVAEAEDKGQIAAFATSFGETIKDPALLSSFLAEQLPQLLVPGAGAGVAGRAALSRGLAAGIKKDLAKAAAVKAGTQAAVGVGAVQQGADVGTQSYEDIYKKLIAGKKSPEEAAGIAINLARAAGVSGAVISLLAQRLPGAKALEEALAGGKGVSGMLIGAGKGALGEGVSEAVEEGGGKFTQNLAMREVDPTQSLMQGVGATAGQAAVGGVGMGGGAGAISGIRGAEPVQVPGQPAAGPSGLEADMQAKRQALAQEQMSVQQGQAARAGEKMLNEEANVQAQQEQVARAEAEKAAAEQLVAARTQREADLKAAFPADYSDVMARTNSYAELYQEKASLEGQRKTAEVRARLATIDGLMKGIVEEDTRVPMEFQRMQKENAAIVKQLPPDLQAKYAAAAFTSNAPRQVEMREATVAQPPVQQTNLLGQPVTQMPEALAPAEPKIKTVQTREEAEAALQTQRNADIRAAQAERKAAREAGQTGLFTRVGTPSPESQTTSQPQEQPVTEPTVRAKPTPETVPTIVTPEILGVLGIGHSAVMRKADHAIQGLDIAKPEEAAQVKQMLTVYRSKPGLSAPIAEKVDAYLARPEFQGIPDVTPPAPQNQPKPRSEPRASKPSVAVPVEPTAPIVAEPGAGAPATTGESTAPVGRGLVPTEQPATQGNVSEGTQPTPIINAGQSAEKRAANKAAQPFARKAKKANEAPATEPTIDTTAPAVAPAKPTKIVSKPVSTTTTSKVEKQTPAAPAETAETEKETVKPSKAVEKTAGIFGGLFSAGETIEPEVEAMAEEMVAKEKPKSKSPFDISGPSLFGEELQAAANEAKKRRSVSVTAEGQTLDSMQAEVANMPGLLGAALRRMLKSGKVKLEAASPDGRKIGGLYDGKSVTLYANGIPSGNVLSVALHEIGAHLGLKNIVGAKQYDAIIARLQAMIEKADGSPETKMAQAAYKRIPIRDMKRGPEVFGDELLAYFVEEMALSEAAGTLPKVGALRNLYNQIKTGILTAINRIFGASLGINDLTAEQVQLLAKAAFTMESFTTAKGEATVESERNSIPGVANVLVKELDPAARQSIKDIQSMFPPEEQGGVGGVLGEAIKGVNNAREKTGIIAAFRQAVADKHASVEAKVSQLFSQGVRDYFGNLNPMVLVRQAEDSTKIVMDFFRTGGIQLSKDGLIETTKNSKSMASALQKLGEFAKANDMTVDEAKNEVSTVLEGHRLHSIYNDHNKPLEASALLLEQQGKIKEADAERAKKIDMHMNLQQIAQLEAIFQKSAGIKGILSDLNATKSQVIDLMVATGRIDKEKGQYWKDNEAYVPFNRIFEDTGPAKVFRGKGLGVLTNIPGMKGSLGRPIKNVIDSYANRLSGMVEDTMKNHAAVKVLEIMEMAGFANEVATKDSAKNKGLVVSLYRDGKPVFFEVQNEYDMLAFQQAPEVINGLTTALGATSRFLRLSITAMPPFAIKQVIEDAQRAAFYSGVERPLVVAMKTLYNMPRVFFGELTGRKSPMVRRMEALGIIGDYDFNIFEPVNEIEKELGLTKRGAGEKLFHRLEQFTKASDLAARLAVYEETMRDTNGDELLAQTRARELINFSRRGSSSAMRTAARVIPFFNAYAQGMDVLYRSATGLDASSAMNRNAARKMFLSRVAMMTALGFVYALSMSDDEGYKNATDDVRDNNWLLPNGYKISLPKELGFMFKSIPERIVGYYLRHGTDEEQTIMEALGSTLKGAMSAYGSPNVTPSIIKPILENMTNYSFFLQRELESASMQKLEPGQRSTSSTSELAKAVGESINVSPIKIDNFLRGTFGMAGATTLLATDAVLNPTRPDRPMYQMPFGSLFLYDTIGGRAKNEFYQLQEKVGQADATFKHLQQTDPEKAGKFLEANAALISVAPMINNSLETLSNLRRMRALYEQGTEEMLGMDGAERRAAIDELRTAENEALRYVRELKKSLADED